MIDINHCLLNVFPVSGILSHSHVLSHVIASSSLGGGLFPILPMGKLRLRQVAFIHTASECQSPDLNHVYLLAQSNLFSHVLC